MVRQHRDELVRLLCAEIQPRMRARFVELLGETQDSSLVEILRAELDTEIVPWALAALERIDHRQIAEDYRRMHPDHD